MQKLLTAEAARNVFKNRSSRDFLKHGGASYISAARLEQVSPQHFAVASLMVAKGAKNWSGEMTHCPEGEKMMKSANKELLEGKSIAGAEMTKVEPDQAAKMVAKAEQQIENNQQALKLSQHEYHTY